MNFLRGIAFLLLVGVVWSTSSTLMTRRLDQLVAIGKIPYGPVPNISENFLLLFEIFLEQVGLV